MELPFDHVVPGHGPLCGKEEVRKQLSLLKKLRDNTLKAIEGNLGLTGVRRPAIYEKASESRVTRTIRHFYGFYSRKKSMLPYGQRKRE